MKNLILAAGLSAIATLAGAQDKPVLTVYTYDSFVSDWGPGPAVEKAFEATCACDLQLVAAGDGASLLSRVQLEGARTEADIILGIDTNLTARAKASGLFAPLSKMPSALDVPVDWTDDTFAPFDWGYFAFVYDNTKLKNVPGSFQDLIEADENLKIVIQDPRSSTPGLGLLMWVKTAYPEKADEIWAALSPRILTVTKGWSEAYGMFLEGEADMVLSYTTSPAYHLIAEEDNTKSAASFSEGHYMQIEVAGKLKSTDQPELADAFIDFMTSDGFQSIIPTTNWMYPAKFPQDGLPKGFETLITPVDSLIVSDTDAEKIRDEALAEWLTALSR
ncbi:thiamine ABC transporter substrate binding subunit [Amylibacter sp. IMCC11727]|uniref:thiamine ABC transporter substrate binding subunit n=1 Tax=Amylibacter sp. IMCC11727 TaxID=3039851 RepID=UPI00244DCE47|nr:thiamine ABC transporter substrate binding subunit [Amylibacter sp. IMCC11727]WGI21717.1 thiamine ABC transporter substrate binding subunit [Amylibacter sp. IMCC11727]